MFLARAALGWLRQNLLIILCSVLIALQFLTWRASERAADALGVLYGRFCGSDYNPCTVSVRNAGEIGREVERFRR